MADLNSRSFYIQIMLKSVKPAKPTANLNRGLRFQGKIFPPKIRFNLFGKSRTCTGFAEQLATTTVWNMQKETYKSIFTSDYD